MGLFDRAILVRLASTTGQVGSLARLRPAGFQDDKAEDRPRFRFPRRSSATSFPRKSLTDGWCGVCQSIGHF